MSTVLDDLTKAKLDLLIREYDIFNGRINTLMLRMSALVAGVLAFCLPPIFQNKFVYEGGQLAILSMIGAACVFLLFQITCQMLVYKRHMVHLASRIKEVDDSLELQWDLKYFSRVYHRVQPGQPVAVSLSPIVVGGTLAYVAAVLLYVPLFLEGSQFVHARSMFVGWCLDAVAWGFVVAGPLLLAKTVRDVNKAYEK